MIFSNPMFLIFSNSQYKEKKFRNIVRVLNKSNEELWYLEK